MAVIEENTQENESVPAPEPSVVDRSEDTPSGMYERKIAWAVISAALIIYLIAFPIRVLYYRYDFTTRILYRLRPWVPVREIWNEQLGELPDFGTRVGLQIAFVACLLSIVAAVIYGLWLILVQPETGHPAERADAT